MNVYDAAEKLPPKAQKPFLKLWKLANKMDLYDGQLELYLAVIADQMDEKLSDFRKVKHTLHKIESLVRLDE